MAKSKSSLKRVKQNEVRRLRNHRIKTTVKTAVKKAEQATDQKERSVAESQLNQSVSIIDKAAAKGVIPKRRASRKVARLSRNAFKRFGIGQAESTS